MKISWFSFCLLLYIVGSTVKGADFFVDIIDTESFPQQNLFGVSQGSVAWSDYDLNGLPDFLLTGVNSLGPITRLYSQNTSGVFYDVTNNQTFPEGTPPNDYISDVKWMDFNSDGRPDFFLTGAASVFLNAKLYSQNSSGVFYDVNNIETFPQGAIPGLSYPSTAWTDFNSDGRLDFFLTGIHISTLYAQLYSQNSTGVFYDITNTQTFPQGIPTPVQIGTVNWIDYDSNNLSDFILTGANSSGINIIQFYSQNSTEVFYDIINSETFPQGPPAGVFYGSVDWRDFNSDGRPDFLLTGAVNTNSFVFCLYSQNSTGVFYNVVNINTFPEDVPNGISQGTVNWIDYNSDGMIDIFVTGYQYPSTKVTRLYSQNYTGTFYDITNTQSFPQGIPPQVSSSSVALSDFNLDGHLDILLIGSAQQPVIKIYQNGCPNNYFLSGSSCSYCPGPISLDQRTCTTCPSNNFFDSSSNTCILCPSNQIPSPDQSECIFCQDGLEPNSTQTGCHACSFDEIYNQDTKLCENKSSSGLSTGGLVGAIVGSILGLFGLLGIFSLIICCCLCCFCAILLIILLFAVILIILVLLILLLSSGVTAGSALVLLMRKSKRIHSDELTFDLLLGTGAFGQVYRGTCQGEIVAIKKLSVLLDQKARDDFLQEADILSKLNHPYIIKYIAAIEGNDICYLVLEFAEKGSLESLMKKERLSLESKLTFAYQISLALEYLHSKGVIHRDLSCRNVLITSDYIAKLTDFGLSRVLEQPDLEGGQTKTNVGPIRWLPIEFIVLRKYSKAGDIYMFGMFLYELLTEKMPYSDISNIHDVVNQIRLGRKPPLDPEWPSEIKELLMKCWQDREEDRPDINSISSHLKPFICQNNLLNNREKDSESTEEDRQEVDNNYFELSSMPQG